MPGTYAVVTVRRLKPGSYEEWRRAWEPEAWPAGLERASILRNAEEPDEILAVGVFEGDREALRGDAELQAMQQARFERMAPFVAETTADGAYELVEKVLPPSLPA